MARKTIPGSPGLWTAPNSESAPPGSLSVAKNVVIRRDGLIGKPRPMRQITRAADMPGSFGASGSYATAAAWRGRLVATNSVTVIGTKASYGGTFAFSQVSGLGTVGRMATANLNLYFAGTDGAYKMDNPAGTVGYFAGVPRALDVQLSLVASGTLLANTNSAAYRIVYGILDANKNLVLGPPSGRAVITGTAAQNVSVKSWLPKAIKAAANATSYFYQVYRSPVQTIAATDPGEELQLVYQTYLTSTDVSNGFVTVTDFTPDNMRGALLYSDPSQQGLDQANYPPPASTDIALFKGTMFYSNTTGKHRTRVQMLGIAANTLTISTAAGGITKSGGSGIATFTGSPDLSGIAGTISITASTSAGNNGEFPITAVDNGAKTITYTNAGAVTEPGTASSRAFAGALTVGGVSYYGSLNSVETVASQIYSVVTTNGTVSQNVRDTCQSLLRVVNQQTSAPVVGFYESGPDDAAGKMLFESTTASSFTVTAPGTLWGNSFAPSLLTAQTSANDAVAGRLYFSKPFQPEHVPLGNYFDIGSSESSITRIIPLREALMVFKDDGLYRVTGDGNSFSVSLADTSVQLLTAQSVTTLSNAIYAMATRGFLRVTEQSVVELGRQVRDLLMASVEGSMAPVGILIIGNYTPVLYASHIDQTITINNIYADSGRTRIGLCYSIPTNSWTQVFQETWYSLAPNFGSASVIVGGLRYDFSTYMAMREDLFHGLTPAAVGSDATHEPVPIHKALINITAVGSSTITVSSTTLDGPYGALVVGGLIEGNAGSGGGGESLVTDAGFNAPVFQITNINGSVLTLALAYGTGAVSGNFQTGLCYAWDDNPAGDPRYAISLQWLPYGGGDIGEATRFSEFAVLLDPMSTTTLQSGSSITVAASTDGAAKANMSVFTPTNTPAPPATPMTQTLLRSLIPPAAQKARAMIGYLTTALCPRSFFYLLGISYEYEPTDGHETT